MFADIVNMMSVNEVIIWQYGFANSLSQPYIYNIK